MSALLATSMALLVIAQVPVGVDPADPDVADAPIAEELDAPLTSGERLRLVADGAGMALVGVAAVTWPLFVASTLPYVLFPYFEAVISRLMPIGLEPILATYLMASMGTLGVVVLTAVALGIATEADPIFFVLAGAPTLAVLAVVPVCAAIVFVMAAISNLAGPGGVPPFVGPAIVVALATAMTSGLFAAPLVPLSLLVASVPADEVSPADDFGLTTLRRWVILHARRETLATEAE